jgi:hypothetical protein
LFHLLGKFMSKVEDKKSLNIKPGDTKKDSAREKAKNLLKNHPEILFSARDLFHNKSGETVIEAKVPRGDISIEDSIMPRTQYDINNEDLQAISKHAKKIVDAAMREYDERVAMEDALTIAIATLDDGKYASKINASTYTLLMGDLVKT